MNSDFNKLESTMDKHHFLMNTTEEWRNGLKAGEKAAITRYTGGQYKEINKELKNLRAGGEPTKTDNKLTTALNKSEAPCDMIVTRGFHPSTMNGKIEAGKVISDKAFVSSSILQGVGEGFGSGKIVATISVFKGSKGAYVRPYSQHPHEYEWLFPPNARFKVLSVSADGKQVNLGYMGSRSKKSTKDFDEILLKANADDNDNEEEPSSSELREERFTWDSGDFSIEDMDDQDNAYWDEIQSRDLDEHVEDDDHSDKDKSKSLRLSASARVRPTQPPIPHAEVQARSRVRTGIASIFDRAADRGGQG